MSASKFDRFMVSADIGRNRKMRRQFTVEERWAWVGGVLCIASDAPIRGYFVVDNRPATAEDLKDEADVSIRAARSALAKFRELEMLLPDSETECERVRDWSDYNPEPKADPTNALRQARWRDRRNADRNATSNGDVTALLVLAVTPPEVRKARSLEVGRVAAAAVAGQAAAAA